MATKNEIFEELLPEWLKARKATDEACGENLHPMIGEYVDILPQLKTLQKAAATSTATRSTSSGQATTKKK